VLELLVRLEPQLKNQPDLWAVRANAAQRLGRHQDSVLAYGVALQSRPAEARWLLGMAVSLAAMGQTSQAGTMVEKARASGPISPDVALYLRQQGVPMPDGK
jgi:MSHA biogenesis protein MshN